ncbi:MAG TPA: nuclear transport factor 2 family protein [Gillisia sp.]|nr:nuclear transport factor 2 family protein [Gillisia sp.]
MKNHFLTLVLFLCIAPIVAQNTADENEVRKLNEAYDQAIKNADVAFYENLLAEDFVSYSTDGKVKNKSEVLEEVKKQKANPTYRMSKIGSDDVKVKLSGNLAVVTAQWNATTHTMEDDEPHEDTGHYVAVYEKRDGKWQLISDMGSEKPHTPEELKPSLEKASATFDEAIKKGDKEAFKKLFAEDYQSTNNEGKKRTREQDIEMMFDPDLKLESMTAEDKEFKIYRNFAVETGQYNVSGSYKGEKFTETGRYTSTWIFKDGKWQLVADHTSTIQPEK